MADAAPDDRTIGEIYASAVQAAKDAMAAAPKGPTGAPIASACTWVHRDTRGLGPAVDAAIARAVAGGWGKGDAAKEAADMRALLFYTLGIVDALSKTPPVDASSSSALVQLADRGLADFASTDRSDAAALILRSWSVVQAYGEKQGGKLLAPPATTWTTNDGAAADYGTPSPNVSGWVWVGAGVAVAGLALAAAWVYSSRATERAVMASTDANVRAMLGAQANALVVLDKHIAREKAAGTTLPFDAGETAILGLLSKGQDAAIAGNTAVGTTAVAGKGDFLSGLGSSGMLILAGVAIALLATKGK